MFRVALASVAIWLRWRISCLSLMPLADQPGNQHARADQRNEEEETFEFPAKR